MIILFLSLLIICIGLIGATSFFVYDIVKDYKSYPMLSVFTVMLFVTQIILFKNLIVKAIEII